MSALLPPHTSTTITATSSTTSSTSGSRLSNDRLEFSFFDTTSASEVASVVPAAGAAAGGVAIAVWGRNFAPGRATACVFALEGWVGATPATFSETSTVRCVAPDSGGRLGSASFRLWTALDGGLSAAAPAQRVVAAAIGDADGVSSSPRGALSTAPLYFTYYDPSRPPTLVGVTPPFDDANGRTLVLLRGSNFAPTGASLYCAFGTLGTSIAEFVNASAIRCRTIPAAHAADVALTATHDDGASWSDAVVFTYYVAGRAPSLTSLTPPYVDVAATAPGPVVTVRGANFAPTSGLQCGFGDHHVTDATFVSSGEVRCAVPRLSDYSAIVHVRHDGSTWSVGGLHLILHNSSQPARVSAVAPRALPVGARDVVEVSGINFFPAEPSQLRCVFARPPHASGTATAADTDGAGTTTSTAATFVSESLLRCAAPGWSAVGTAVVAVSFDGGSHVSAAPPAPP